MTSSILSHSVQETRAFGAQVAKTAQPGDVFALEGELGCGKTEFARGFIEALCGTSAAAPMVRSPTFSIINIHEAPEFSIYHFDFYRLKKIEELVEIGYYDCIRSGGISLIEWADMFPEALPTDARHIRFLDNGKTDREILI